MRIINNYTAAIGLPNGQTIEAGDSAEFVGDAAAWAKVKGHPVVSHWLKVEALSIEGDEPAKGDKAPKLPELPKP